MKTLVVSLFIVINTAYLFAQSETQWLPDYPGKLTFHHKISGEIEKYKLTPAELITYQKKIDAIVETLHQNPVLKNPIGFEPSVNVLVWPDDKLGYKTISLADEIVGSRIAIQFCPYLRDESGNVKKHCMEVSSCDVHLNQPKATTEKYLNFTGSDAKTEEAYIIAQRLSKIFIKPLVVKELAEGVTAYSSGIIIVSNPNRPYWIPVTTGNFFDLLLKLWELGIKSGITGAPDVFDIIKAEKEALTQEELKLPAYFDNGKISQITVIQNNSPLIRFNPDYFDRSLPRTSIQLIAMHTLTDSFIMDCDYKELAYQKHCEFVKLLDVRPLQALIEVK